jgi:hypothetical protein
MAARIGLSTGKEFVVDGTVDEVASNMIGGDPFANVESNGRRVYIFRAHVAYVEDQPGSVYEERGALGVSIS